MTGYRFVSSHEDVYPVNKLCDTHRGLEIRLLRLGGPGVVSHDSLRASAPSRATTDG